MNELHKFLFEGLPVRGMLVKLDNAWQEILLRRATSPSGPYPDPVKNLLGEMAAAAVLLQSTIKFNGTLILQIEGDGPVKLAVAEVQSSLGLRVTAKVTDVVASDATFQSLVNSQHKGRCAITLDAKDRAPGQPPYQGIVALQSAHDAGLDNLSTALENYMQQSEQLETILVLAANDIQAAGLLIQRLPIEGQTNIGHQATDEAAALMDEAYTRISHLAHSLTKDELLSLNADTIFHRLFWNEPFVRLDPPLLGNAFPAPHFACTCSRERVAQMLFNLGEKEVNEILTEQNQVDITCDFCGATYVFDAVDVGSLFTPPEDQVPGSGTVQ